MDESNGEIYPVEGADWISMGKKDEVWWRGKGFERKTNTVLVEEGVFQGKFFSNKCNS